MSVKLSRPASDSIPLLMLPGLICDSRIFDGQTAAFGQAWPVPDYGDATTLAEIRDNGGEVDSTALEWHSDDDAVFERVATFDATRLAPQVSAPHSPGNTTDVDRVGRVRARGRI